MDSPGGSHNGLFRIDPRLAWSEGWGNFLGAHIFRNQIASINPQANTALTTFDGWLYYLDTNGYSDSGGTASELIRLSLKKPGNNPDIYSDTNSNGVCDATEYCYDKVDAAANPGEGHFREVSIARALFKSTNTCTGGTCTNTNYFAKIWEAFEKNPAGVGMGKSAYYFRSSVRFYDRMAATSGGVPVAIDTILNSDEAQQRNGNASYTPANLIWPSYGIKLVPTMVACNLEIEPRNQSALTTNQQPDQRYSSHFYYLDKATSLAGVTSFTLNTTFVAGTALSFGMRAYSDGYTFDTSNTSYTASIATGTLASSTPYILNIKAFTGSITVSPTTRYTYTLTTNNAGEFLCPSPTF
jgi:hypothetical protein